MTGRYPARIGITDWIRSEFQEGTIPEDRRNPTEYVVEPDKKLQTPPNPLWMEHDEVTVAEVLKEAGYTSAHIGNGIWVQKIGTQRRRASISILEVRTLVSHPHFLIRITMNHKGILKIFSRGKKESI